MPSTVTTTMAIINLGTTKEGCLAERYSCNSWAPQNCRSNTKRVCVRGVDGHSRIRRATSGKENEAITYPDSECRIVSPFLSRVVPHSILFSEVKKRQPVGSELSRRAGRDFPRHYGRSLKPSCSNPISRIFFARDTCSLYRRAIGQLHPEGGLS